MIMVANNTLKRTWQECFKLALCKTRVMIVMVMIMTMMMMMMVVVVPKK